MRSDLIGAAKRWILALGGQGLVSGFHFLLNIFLIRSLDPTGYGTFALGLVAAIFITGVSGALVGLPLSIHTAGLSRRAPRAVLESVLTAVHGMLMAGAMLVTFGLAIVVAPSLAAACAFTLFATAYPFRQYGRAFAFARKRPSVAVFSDVVYTMLGGVLLAAAWLFPLRSDLLIPTFIVLAAANAVAGLAGLQALGVRWRLKIRPRVLLRYRPIWQEVRWSLVGVITTTLQMQAHSLVVPLLVGPAAYASLAAGQILFAPVRVAVQAWTAVARPDFAIAFARQRRLDAIHTALASLALLIAGAAVVCAAIVFAWSPIREFLYQDKYADQPMGLIVILSGAITCTFALGAVPGCLLQALRRFRYLAGLTLVGSVLSLSGASLSLLFWPPAISLAAVLAAELYTSVSMSVAAARGLRRSPGT